MNVRRLISHSAELTFLEVVVIYGRPHHHNVIIINVGLRADEIVVVPLPLPRRYMTTLDPLNMRILRKQRQSISFATFFVMF